MRIPDRKKTLTFYSQSLFRLVALYFVIFKLHPYAVLANAGLCF